MLALIPALFIIFSVLVLFILDRFIWPRKKKITEPEVSFENFIGPMHPKWIDHYTWYKDLCVRLDDCKTLDDIASFDWSQYGLRRYNSTLDTYTTRKIRTAGQDRIYQGDYIVRDGAGYHRSAFKHGAKAVAYVGHIAYMPNGEFNIFLMCATHTNVTQKIVVSDEARDYINAAHLGPQFGCPECRRGQRAIEVRSGQSSKPVLTWMDDYGSL